MSAVLPSPRPPDNPSRSAAPGLETAVCVLAVVAVCVAVAFALGYVCGVLGIA